MAHQQVVLATGSFDRKVRLWEATTGVCTQVYKYGESQVNTISISPDKYTIAAGGNPKILLFDLYRRYGENSFVAFEGHINNVTEVGFHKDGRWLYSCSEDGTIKIWDVRTPNFQRNYDCQSPVNSVVLHPNQAEIISADQSGSLKVWDLTAGACRSEVTPLPDTPLRSLSMACDASMIAAGSHKGKVFVYSRNNPMKELVHVADFQAHNEYLLKCVISPDVGSIATTSADNTIKLFSTSTWTCTTTLSQHQRWVWDAVFSADSSYMVTASSDSSGKLWDLNTGAVLRTYIGHGLAVTCVALNDTSMND